MKRVKTILFVAVTLIVVLLVFQNQDFFMSKQVLSLDFYFSKYETPLLPSITIFSLCFILGLLIPTISYFSSKIRHEKIMKLLRSREASLLKLVSSLREEVEKSKTSNENDFKNAKVLNTDNLK